MPRTIKMRMSAIGVINASIGYLKLHVFLAAESLTAHTGAAIFPPPMRARARVPEIRELYLISRYSGRTAEIPLLFPAKLTVYPRRKRGTASPPR